MTEIPQYLVQIGQAQTPVQAVFAQVLLHFLLEIEMGIQENRESSKITYVLGGESQERPGVAVLSDAELSKILSAKSCLSALEEMYANLYQSPEDCGKSVEFKTKKGKFHIKAGLSPKTHTFFAAKINANFPDNPKQFGLPTIQGLIVLCKCEDGSPVAILPSGALTGLRTAAATALAAKHGAREDSRILAIVGCGVQARYHLKALLDILPIRKVMAFDNDAEKVLEFTRWVERNFDIEFESANSAAEAIRTCDICVTCTTSTRPIIDVSMLPPGCFIAAVGADNPDKQEIDPKIFANARIIVDDLKQCSVYGDLAHALREGAVKADDVSATLAELAAGVKQGRTSHSEIVIFDSTGVGVQDVAAATVLIEAIS